MKLLFIPMLSAPAINILLGLLFVLLLIWFFWPGRGGLALMGSFSTNRKKAMLEDALKYLFDCEYRNQPCDINSLAGNLHISGDKASDTVQSLISMGLATSSNHDLSLTDTGRSYALRVIRVHRIWEKYLAEETGVASTHWHTEADRVEHMMTEDSVEELAARMGHPVFDPHGDPIPTVLGELPDNKGVLLSSLKEGDMGLITHLEDEPRTIYDQLVVFGLYAGMQVYVTDVTPQKITIVAGGDEVILTPFFASQVTVNVFSENEPVREKHNNLALLQVGQSAEVAGISPHLRGQQRRRLMDLGIVPGTEVRAVIRSASGDPVGYRIMGTMIGIRKSQAEHIYIKNIRTYEPEYQA